MSTNNLDYIERVTVKFDNVKPVEVIDFLTSIQGFHNQYKQILKQEKIKYNDEDVKLYINIREGCIEWEFTRLAVQKTFVFFYNKLLFKAWDKLKTIYEKISKEQDLEESNEDLINTQKILQTAKSDLASKMTLKYQNNETKLELEITGTSGRAVYDKIGDIIDKSKSYDKSDFKNALAKLILTDKNVIKCKIEEISEKEVPILCNPELKQKFITENEKNPFSTYYIVNGKIKKSESKILLYELTEIVEIIVDE